VARARRFRKGNPTCNEMIAVPTINAAQQSSNLRPFLI
jgi:hypothetical protein